ncbi:hypothetical protein CY35_18G099000 [Sphagnum magellanicum]|nr:hypothetical protein CY35_18G099000 [Sphagnum magellanicum]
MGGGPLPGILDKTSKRRKPDDANGPAKKKRKKKIAQKIFQKTGLSQKVQVDKSVPPLVSSSRLAFEGNHHLSGKLKKSNSEVPRTAAVSKHSFKSVLSSAASYKWIYNENSDYQHFIEEARQLKTKSTAELAEMRELLLQRNLELTNLIRYPTQVIRVFVFILRLQDPPASMGKIELASLCVEWRCKYKRYWCSLEAGHMQSLIHSLTKEEQPVLQNGLPKQVTQPSSGLLSSHHESKTNGQSFHENNGACTDLPVLAACSALHNKQAEETTSPEAQKLQSGLSMHDANRRMGVVSEDVLPVEMAKVGHNRGTTKPTEDAVLLGNQDGALSEGALLVQGDRISANDSKDKEVVGLTENAEKRTEGRTDMTEPSGKRAEVPEAGPVFEPAATVCLCRICIDDASFCRGCMCSFCKEEVSPTEKPNMLDCATCLHVCHFLCAYNAQQAGVSKQLTLDGEFMCSGCGQKGSLLPFWKRTLGHAVGSTQLEEIEEQLSVAVMTMRDTENAMYLPLLKKSIATHQLVQQCTTPSTDVYNHLQQIRDELDALGDPDSDSVQAKEWARQVLQEGHGINWLEEERRVNALQKQANQEYEDWTQAEKLAETNRSQITQNANQAEADAKLHMQRASSLSLQAHNARHRLKVMKQVWSSMSATLEQVETQRAELQDATAALEQLQHDVAYFQAPAGEEAFSAFSALLERLSAQRDLVEVARVKLDYILSLYESQ